MANLKLQEKVVIAAPVAAVWRFLLDPERVVLCLPGAAYDGKESEHVFLGHIKVKVGPVTTLFAGKATMSEIDEAARSLRITGEGKDKNGAGTAKMVMRGKVAEVEGGAELSIDAEVDIAGKLVTFGRGLIQAVSAQLFKQFSARAQELLAAEASAAETSTEASAAEASTAGTADATAASAEATAADATAADAAAEPTDSSTTRATDEGTARAEVAPAGAALQTKIADAPRPAPAARAPLAKRPAEEESLNALALVLRAIGASIAGFFRRLFGRKPR